MLPIRCQRALQAPKDQSWRPVTKSRPVSGLLAALALTLAIGASTGIKAANALTVPHLVKAGWMVRQPTRFFVSGVLRKDGTVDVIKPVHAVEEANTAEAAEQLFSRDVQQQFTGYTLIATTVSPVPVAGVCEIST